MNQAVLDDKKALVQEISEKFSNATSSVIVEYRGLSVGQITQLRRNLRNEGIDFKVYKNSMAQRAAVVSGYDDLVNDLTGPNAIAFGQDAVAPSRVLAEFAKKNKALVLKSGIVEGKVVDASMIQELSKLPNRDGMISMLLGMFQAPVRNFAYALTQVAATKEAAPVEKVEAKAEPKAQVNQEAKAEATETVVAEAASEAPAEAVKEEETN